MTISEGKYIHHIQAIWMNQPKYMTNDGEGFLLQSEFNLEKIRNQLRKVEIRFDFSAFGRVHSHRGPGACIAAYFSEMGEWKRMPSRPSAGRMTISGSSPRTPRADGAVSRAKGTWEYGWRWNSGSFSRRHQDRSSRMAGRTSHEVEGQKQLNTIHSRWGSSRQDMTIAVHMGFREILGIMITGASLHPWRPTRTSTTQPIDQ